MSRLNIFKRTPGKPMIYSLESAKLFLEECKERFIVPCGKSTSYHFYNGKVESVHTQAVGYIGCDTVLWTLTETDAIKWTYRNRAIINVMFT